MRPQWELIDATHQLFFGVLENKLEHAKFLFSLSLEKHVVSRCLAYFRGGMKVISKNFLVVSVRVWEFKLDCAQLKEIFLLVTSNSLIFILGFH